MDIPREYRRDQLSQADEQHNQGVVNRNNAPVCELCDTRHLGMCEAKRQAEQQQRDRSIFPSIQDMRNLHAQQQAQQVKEGSQSSYTASSSAAPSPWIKADGPVTKLSQDAQVFKQQEQPSKQPGSLSDYQEGRPCPQCRSITMPTPGVLHVTCINCRITGVGNA
jgi:hypothetical protein